MGSRSRTLTRCVQEDACYCTLKLLSCSVGKLANSGVEVKFGCKGSWIDLHTDTGMQRVPVRVKGKTCGLSIQNTDALRPGGTRAIARSNSFRAVLGSSRIAV